MTLGEKIKKARLAAGLTQHELGERVGISQMAVSSWERGNTTPRDQNLEAVESVLGDLTPEADDDRITVSEEGPSPFGAWLAKVREARGLTRVQLSDRAGVSHVAIYNLESGRTQNPQERTRDKLTSALGELVPDDAVEATEEAAEIEGVGRLTDFDPHDEDDLPDGPGVYVFYDISQRPIYVGESGNMSRRIREHLDKFWFRAPIVASGSYVEVRVERLRKQVEQVLIRFLKSNAVINKQHVDR